jgi:hypothetical protein
MLISRWALLRMRNVSDRSCQNQNTHLKLSILFFFYRKWFRLWDNVEKCGGVREVSDDSIIRRMRCACWITKAYRHIRTLCNTYCFLTAKIVTRTHLSSTFNMYIACLVYCFCWRDKPRLQFLYQQYTPWRVWMQQLLWCIQWWERVQVIWRHLWVFGCLISVYRSYSPACRLGPRAGVLSHREASAHYSWRFIAH